MQRSFRTLFGQLVSGELRTRSSRTIEIFGWVILFEGSVMLLAPGIIAGLLGIEIPSPAGADYFRLAGMLVGGLGMLYVVSGRLDAEAFTFASLLDRPIVPFLMLALWQLEIIPGALALAFALQDGASFLWTLATWRAERAAGPA